MKPVCSERRLGRFAATLFMINVAASAPIEAQTFSSGSDGSDGIYAPSGSAGTVVIFDPSQFRGSQVAANIFNFTTVTIPVGVTVRLSSNVINGPVYWLAQSDVNIAGTVDLNGGNGYDDSANPFARVPSVPGAGGFPGGVGGLAPQNPLPGSGPGGGCAACVNVFNYGLASGGGGFSGNQFLIPLTGGSGGGGAGTTGGGAGGGAILIASSTRIVVNGSITANGGDPGILPFWGHVAGGGSGGAIRLISNTISGSGALSVSGGGPTQGGASGPGRIRLEGYAISLGGGTQSAPFPLLLPTGGPSTAKVVSIGGVLINPNPNSFPDITINTAAAVPVVIQTHNIPMIATINLTILDENGVADTVIPVPPIGNCDQNNFCTTTVNVVFPFGASRGLTKVTWTQ